MADETQDVLSKQAPSINESQEDDFGFPFKPYDIQVQFMRSLYECIDKRKIGIFESPTGTGKSLSLICGALKWLRDHQTQERDRMMSKLGSVEQEIKKIESASGGDWLAEHANKQKLLEEKLALMSGKKMIDVYDQKTQALRERRKSKKLVDKKSQGFLLNTGDGQNQKRKAEDIDLKDALQDDLDFKKVKTDLNDDDDLLIDYASDTEKEEEEKIGVDKDEEDTTVAPKIYFCSRTHSQLSQFVNEIKRTIYSKDQGLEHQGGVRVTTLGSRANLCINPQVSKIKNINLMNERCLELIQKSSSKSKCEFYKPTKMKEVQDDILSEVQDIEEVAETARRSKGCPYFASRFSVKDAELVILPYNILIHEASRKSFNINLNSGRDVIIIDEAHNLIETISNIYSIEINGGQLLDAHSQLTQYMTRYSQRLNASNLMHIKQILSLLQALIKCLHPNDSSKSNSQCFQVVPFLIEAKIDHFNLFKIVRFCEESQIARKLYGFSARKLDALVTINPANTGSSANSGGATLSGTKAFLERLKQKKLEQEAAKKKKGRKKTNQDAQIDDKSQAAPSTEEETSASAPTGPSSPIYQIIEFIRALTEPSVDGRIFISLDATQARKSTFKFTLLNPAAHFSDIVANCRSLVLAGGTMEPVSEFVEQLFGPLHVPSERIHRFSCGHVIPDQNLLLIGLESGPSGKTLDFNFKSRNNTDVIDDAGRVLLNSANFIPGGIVIFFPSYDYEEKVYNQWSKSGLINSVETRTNKRFFREPKQANQVTACLEQYCTVIRLTKTIGKAIGGAILMCVIGGKMSEGINFSDDMARAVIVIGMPYANIKSAELQEKMRFLDQNQGSGQGKIYYENICFKALNQTIGRAIRHRNDYALIMLIDSRYATRPSIPSMLPKWMRSRFTTSRSFGQALPQIINFFKTKSLSTQR